MSAASILAALDRNKYEVVPIGVTREGTWLLPEDAIRTLQQGIDPEEGKHVAMIGDPSRAGLVTIEEGLPGSSIDRQAVSKLDVVFPVLHGPYGEDGTVQGLLELAGVPYVGSGVLGSAVGMDKGVMKNLFVAEGLRTPAFQVILRRNWERDPEGVMHSVDDQFAYPLFVKPANLGSSVGITKVKTHEDLRSAMDLAVEYDRRVVVEQGIEQAREIECSVLGNDDPRVSVAGEIIPANKFYDYDAKYINESSKLIIPADLPAAVETTVREYAVRAFKALDCAGMARADFLVRREDDEVYINELNTIPGFTRISMYPKLWEASGLSYPELVDQLIELAIERYNDRQRSLTTYRS